MKSVVKPITNAVGVPSVCTERAPELATDLGRPDGRPDILSVCLRVMYIHCILATAAASAGWSVLKFYGE